MKRPAIVSLVALHLLWAAAAPVFGSGPGYRELALSFLVAKYKVAADQVELADGGVIELQSMAESFWVARYAVGTGSQPTAPAQRLPLPAGPVTEDPGHKSEPTAPTGPGASWGAVYVKVSTGEIVELDEMEAYFAAERAWAAAEWERLQAEAGKLDVALYLRLQTTPAAEAVAVIIVPTYLETPAIFGQLQALRSKYPEFTTGDGTLRDGGSGGAAVPAPARPDIATLSGTKEDPGPAMPAVPADRPTLAPAAPDDDEYRQRWLAYQDELRTIRAPGLAGQLAVIEQALEAMEVPYQHHEDQSSVTATLTAAQIQALAALSAVASIREELYFSTMVGSDVGRVSTPEAEPAGHLLPPAVGAAPAASTAPWLYLLLLVLVPGVLGLHRRR